jgi:hypothetical protein
MTTIRGTVRRRRGGVRAATAAIVIVLVGSIGAALPASAFAETAEAALARAEKFLKKAKAVEFTAAVTASGAPVGSLEQAAVFPDRGRSLLTTGTDEQESIFIKDVPYHREATDGGVEDLPILPAYGHPDEYLAFERPQDIAEIVDLLENPAVVSADSKRTVVSAAFKDPANVLRATPNPYTSAQLEVTIAPNGEPTAFTLSATGSDGDVTATSTDVAWNGHPSIPKSVKRQSRLASDDVAGYTDASVYQPKAVPKGWKLDLAEVVPPELTAEVCEQAHTVYALPSAPIEEFIETFQFPTACANPNALQNPQPLTVGPYQGQIFVGDLIGAQFDANGTTVQVTTSLDRDDFEAILGDLVPFDPDRAPPGTA